MAAADPPVPVDPAVAAPARTFVAGAAQTALRVPSADLTAPGPDIGYPTMVVVEAGEGWTDAKTPAAAPPGAQVASASGAGQPPVEGTTSLLVQLGDRPVTLRPTEEAMWGYVTLAFKIGGFAQVIQARKAIDAAVAPLVAAADEAEDAAKQADALRDAEERRITDVPLGQGRDSAAWRLRSAAGESGRKGRELRARANAAQWFKTSFNDVWAQLATIEEACLREWEGVAVREFQEILEAHMRRANQQWIRYGCYLKDRPGETAKISESSGKAASLKLKLDRERPAGSPPADANSLPTLRDLWTRANDLADYRKTTIPKALQVAAAVRERGDPASIKLFDQHVDAIMSEWSRKLDEAETTDAALLQIYHGATKQTTLDDIESMIINALLDAYHLSKDLRDHTVRLLGPRTKARIQPGPTVDPRRPWGLTDAERAVVSASAYGDDAPRLRLVVPASVVLSVTLEESGSPQYSPWMHLPVRLSTAARVQRIPRLAQLMEQGTLGDAAVTHAFEEIESFRERDRERFGRWSLAVLGVGLVLAPFTSGGSLVVAGLVAASFQIAAFMEEYGRVEIASKLARSTLDALETASWTRPSRVALYRLALSTAIDVGQTVVAPEVPFVVDLLIMAASWAISPGEQPSKGARPPELRSPQGGR